MTVRLVSASTYTIEQLAGIYNETRVDYLVPMPMNSRRLAEYVHDFDIDMSHSVVALIDDKVVGLGMLGLRDSTSWVTRLGVLPNNRRIGIGEAILTKMLDASRQFGMKEAHLEVINGNERALALFNKLGFVERQEYLVLRRAPSQPSHISSGSMMWLDKTEALRYLQTAPRQTWINSPMSMKNMDNLGGMHVNENDGKGWILFRKSVPQLSHIVLHTEAGDPKIVGESLLKRLHAFYPRFDTYAENISCNDPHLPAFLSQKYFEVFRRTEMILFL